MYLQMANESIRVPCVPAESVSDSGSETFEFERLVENSSEDSTGNNQYRGYNDSFIESFTESRCGIYDQEGTSTSYFGNVTDERCGSSIAKSEIGSVKRNNPLVDFVFNHLCSPPELVEETECFLETKYTSWKPQNRQNAYSIVCRKIKNMSVAEIESLILNRHPTIKVNCLHLAAVNCEFNEYYYSLAETIDILFDLFRYQLNDVICDEDDIANFVNVIWRWLNRQNGKKNTVQIVGPPTSYKSAFGTLLGEAMLTPGYCQTLNKNERFSLENLIDRRIGIMDDPSFASDQVEKLLTIFSGDKTVVNVKFQPHRVLTHTPILILCNRDMFHGDKRFQERIVSYQWKRYNKILTKKMNPMAMYALFNKYVTEYLQYFH